VRSRLTATTIICSDGHNAHTRRTLRCCKYVAEFLLREWLEDLNNHGIGPTTDMMVTHYLNVWPLKDLRPDLFNTISNILSKPKNMKVWGHRFRRRWMVGWKLGSNREAVSPELRSWRVWVLSSETHSVTRSGP
jgi:hypothetical protein